MIIVRDIFQIEFGKAKDVTAIWKEGFKNAKSTGFSVPYRAMTDLVGNFYTFILEGTFESLSHYEKEMSSTFSNQQWRDWYQKMLPYLKSGRREIYNLID